MQLTSENLLEFKWNINDRLEIDYHNFFYKWKSTCKKSTIKVHFNKSIILFKYPIKIPTNEKYDEFENKYDIRNTSKKYSNKIKNIFKYTYNEQEFSTRHLPQKYANIHKIMLDKISKIEDCEILVSANKDDIMTLSFETALPLTCESTHLHRFDQVQTTSEPKVLYVNKAWYKLFYRENKSIEISCPSPIEKAPAQLADTSSSGEKVIKTHETCSKESNELFSCVDYLISDSLTGRYYTCYSLNERSCQVDEIKICLDSIPSFKQNLNKLLGYSTILLKRLSTISTVTNYLTCLSLAEQRAKYDSLTENSEIKTQSVITNVGHFKYFYNNTIFIQFIDKIRLYVDSESINNFDISNLNDKKCLATVILPDLSQHEINFASVSTPSLNFFAKYIDFMIQWLKHLFPDKFQVFVENKSINENSNDSEIDINSIKCHFNKLKLFNFTIEQDLNYKVEQQEEQENIYDSNTVNNLLKQNSDFLKNISKPDL